MGEIEKLLKKASISMLLESYDAIFSDFDPRPFSERSFSDDFLAEANKVVQESRGGVFELHFLIPKHLHNPHDETVIKERLHKHFRQSEHLLKAESVNLTNSGIILTVIGFCLMMIVSLTTVFLSESIWHEILRVLFEPGGWFMVWYGLDRIFYVSRQKRKELEFYTKMTKAEIFFDGY